MILLPPNVLALHRLHNETVIAVLELRAELQQKEQTRAQNVFVNVLRHFFNNHTRILFLRFAEVNGNIHESLSQFKTRNLRKLLFSQKSGLSQNLFFVC